MQIEVRFQRSDLHSKFQRSLIAPRMSQVRSMPSSKVCKYRIPSLSLFSVKVVLAWRLSW